MYRNISVFVLLALLASAMGGITKEEMESYKQTCITETGITPELVKMPISLEGPVDEKLKCFGACIINQRGGVFRGREDDSKKLWKQPCNYKFTAEGTLDLEKAISAIPPDMPTRDKVIAALTACASKTGENDCETAYEIGKCLHEQKMSLMDP